MSSAAREKLYGVVVFVVAFVAVVGYGRVATWRAEQAAVAEREAQIEWHRQPPNVASPQKDGEEEMAPWFGNRAESPMICPADDAYILGSRFPAAGGAALITEAWTAWGAPPGSWPNWPNWPPELLEKTPAYYDGNLSLWVTHENGEIVSGKAYLMLSPDELNYNNVMMSVYDTSMNFLGGSDAVTVGEGPAAWYEFDFSTPVPIDLDDDYYLCIWQQYGPAASVVMVGLGDYSGPVQISVSNVVEVASAGVAFEINTTVKTIRDVVVAADEPIGFRHSLTVNDAVVADASQTPTLVSPCFGRYIELETMLRISTPRQVSSEGTVTPPDPLPPDDTEETPETDQIITQSGAAVSGASGSTCTRGS
jgi:hypothetical protein